MEKRIRMSVGGILFCLGCILFVVSPTAGVSFKGEKVEDEGLGRIVLSRDRGVREAGNSVSQGPLTCRGLYSYCWSDWDCCSTWCNGWCYCLYEYEACYYDYECCTGWCDRYYGCTYPYAQSKKGVQEIPSSEEGRSNNVMEKVE